jgi:phospholipase A-2-activating protein
MIRVFDSTGKLMKTIGGNKEVVRALCRVPKNHPSGAQFASASNDGVIRLWTLSGNQVGELHGHESFIYSLASLPSGELVSSGEDRTVRIWKGYDCIQTITHPAISIWSVAVNAENGDLVTGASDRIARVFTRSKERGADPVVVAQFEDSVKQSSIPQQQVGGEINKEKLPGPEFLKQKSGTKEGQVQMIREDDGSVTAHQWSQGTQQWISVGTVVDAVGSSGRKEEYLGENYDYVFNVDIEDGKPPLKLPYNLSQNPYEAATKFIQDNELSMNYLDQTANFIVQNTQGATIGQSSQPQPPTGSDPWGQESRYRPGETSQPAPPSPQPASRPKVLPQTTYLSIKSANMRTIQNKIEELNQTLITTGSKELSISPSDITTLQLLTATLSKEEPLKASPGLETAITIVLKIVVTWPPANRLPGLDFLRIIGASTPLVAEFNDNGKDLIATLADTGVFEDKDRPNNIMLCIRLFANIFEFSPGRTLAINNFDKLLTLLQNIPTGFPAAASRNLSIAISTLYINFSVLLTSDEFKEDPETEDRALSLLDEIIKLANKEKDSEVVYRCLVALGTLVKGLGGEVKGAAKEVFEVETLLKKVEGAVKEPRTRGVVGEIRDALK